MGVGDPDLYKAFSWRFWGLLREGGHAGVVLPAARSLRLAAQHGAKPSSTMEDGSTSRRPLNRGGWMFDDAEPRYTVGLVVLAKEPWPGGDDASGPFRSRAEMEADVERAARTFPLRSAFLGTRRRSAPVPEQGLASRLLRST